MPNALLSTVDYWRVNSYGYPNPFVEEGNSREAWATFVSFFEHDGRSYTALKQFWESSKAPRKLNSHAVESWKATFEEFGLLYVISRSNEVVITPAGKQFYDAATKGEEEEFVWIGLNLLLRYPLQGPPRGRSKSPAHGTSNLLLYRFLYSAIRDLGDYFWWTELERVFCRVFETSEAIQAVAIVRQMRDQPASINSFPLPVQERKGGFYNSLNQVVVHAGMNHLVLTQDNESEHYGTSENRRRHFMNRSYLNLVSTALGDLSGGNECAVTASYVDRLPTAPSFNNELLYFKYLGAPVPPLKDVVGLSGPQSVSIAGDTVFVLERQKHFADVDGTTLQRRIRGEIHTLCRIARNHRVILSSDMDWTYLVVGKEAVDAGGVQLTLRRARPIINIEPIEVLLRGDDVEHE